MKQTRTGVRALPLHIPLDWLLFRTSSPFILNNKKDTHSHALSHSRVNYAKLYRKTMLICIAGLFLFATGTVFTFRSNVGLGPWDVLHLGISRHTPLTFGEANIVVGAIVILIGLLIRAYPGVGTILNMVLIGVFVDLQLRWNWLPDFSSAPLLVRLLIDIIGVFITGIGTALYISPRLGAGPRDGLMMRLHTSSRKRASL